MNLEEFEKLQHTEIEIMDVIHKICVENNIIYYLIGGAAIGAVRHQGPIPWDVDIDIGMPRSDYTRFREYCINNLNQTEYEYHDWRNTKDFIPPHALFCKKGTSIKTIYTKYNRRKREFGIFIDIIPLDNAPKDEKELEKLEKKLRFVQKIKDRKICYFYNDYKNHTIEHIVKSIISKMLFWISVEKLNQIEEKVMMTYALKDTGYMASMAGRYGFDRECKANSIYGTPQLVPFAGRSYYVPEKVHEFLTINYGNYMQLPPKEEQNANYSYFEEITF